MSDHIEVYRDRGGRWRWRRVAANHMIVADSAQGYRWRRGALRAARREGGGMLIRVVGH